MTVLESLRCPGCSTRFSLGAPRVRPGLRRARCFRCGSVFPIDEAVARLLASVPAAAPKEPEPLAAPAAEGLPEVHAPAPEPAEAPEPARGTGFASAKDAIEQLMGTAPSQPIRAMRMGSRSTMDVEATLDRPGVRHPGRPHPAPEAPRALPVPGRPGPRRRGAARAAPKSDMSSTVKLTSEEIRVAMAASSEPRPAAPMPPAPPRPSYQPPADMPGALPGTTSPPRAPTCSRSSWNRRPARTSASSR